MYTLEHQPLMSDREHHLLEENPDPSPAEQERLRQLRQLLDEAQAQYEIIPHSETVSSAQDGVAQGLGTLAQMAPTFLLRSDQGWISAIVSGESRLAYKKIRKQLGLKDVALAKPDVVQQVTGSPIGTVALINPGLRTIVDSRLTALESVYGGCGVPRHTLRIRVQDLIAITQAQVFDFTELKGNACNL
jgi:prolyl-tRNA editing enzyme YbaK/EbsC (Cys-tRNA(Pro) deacylase)